ncbi:MAG: maleylpyruvate isomerase family mycothiol-dependent enzyme [Ilumatobacteraceae bacterium]
MGPSARTAAPDAWIAVAMAEHRRLLDRLEERLAAGTLDASAPSLLPDWTVGHVITHVTHSGDGHLRMLDAAAAGEVGRQYPGGREQRNSGIERGAFRTAAEQVDGLRWSIAALEARWAAMPDWSGTGASMGGDVSIADLPFLRIREVAIHHADLGLGYTFDDLPDVYVREELRRMAMLWAARQPMGMTALPPSALALAPAQRLAWLMGRAAIEGLDPAAIY